MRDLAQKNSADYDSPAFDAANLNAAFFSGEPFAQSKGKKFVVFCLGAKFFAVLSNEVAEVAQRLLITPLPNVPEWLIGIADLRGAIISIVSLQKFLDAPEATLSPRTKFIVLRSPNFPSTVAVAVDRLCEIVVLPKEEIQPIENEKTPLFFGRTAYKSNSLCLLNVEKLFSSLMI